MDKTALADIPLFVLAGGKATRLKEFSADTPKYLIQISAQKTFADIHLQWARDQGFQKVILSVGHFSEQIKKYCGDGSKWNLQISYCDDGATLQGTGGAVHQSLEFKYTYLAITYGDTLLRLNAAEIFANLKASSAVEGIMTFYKLDIPGHTANAEIVNGFAHYDKQNPNAEWNLIDYGFMILKRNLVEQFPLIRPLDLAQPLGKISMQNKILGAISQERFWEIGSPESLLEFKQMIELRQS